MRVKNLILASSAALALSAGAAMAEPNGWYGAVDAGWHAAKDVTAVNTSGRNQEWEFDLNDGWSAFARLGYRLDANWRLELEGGYRSGEVTAMTGLSGNPGLPAAICAPVTLGACGSPEGDINTTTLMLNTIYDFGSADSSFRPFVGIGAGLARVNTDLLGTVSNARTTGFAADDSSVKLASQALAGVAWAIGDRAHLDLTYRYLLTQFEFDSRTSVTANSLGRFEGNFKDSHSVTLG
ncbi:outer membrane beta-barrel protein, partial [Rhizobium sp. CRIBSB]|nr:outer membrane beta-barrel protein [Rhizobium sp. CRIBSB]